MEPSSVPLPPKGQGAPGLSQRKFKGSRASPVKLEHLHALPLHLVLPACRCPYREGLDSFPFLWRLDLVGKKPGGKWRTGRNEGKRKACRLLSKCLVPAFLSENPELKTMVQAEDAYKSLRHLKIRRKPSISGPPHLPPPRGPSCLFSFWDNPTGFFWVGNHNQACDLEKPGERTKHLPF